jgi:hypothetical protein
MHYTLLACLLTAVSYSGISAAEEATPAKSEISNTTCPVSGKVVDPSVKTEVYHSKNSKLQPQGKGVSGATIGFCCDKCQAKYDADPAKYDADLRKQIDE